MIDENTGQAREYFEAIAVVEHNQMKDPKLSTFDICDLLWPLWMEVKEEAGRAKFNFSVECIVALNVRIAKVLGVESGEFRNRHTWDDFVEACGSAEDDPEHVFSWMLSAIYWNRLTNLRLVTAWIFVNAMRIQYGQDPYRVSLEKLGPFLYSLSGSGPPIYDGQTFYPDDYSSS